MQSCDLYAELGLTFRQMTPDSDLNHMQDSLCPSGVTTFSRAMSETKKAALCLHVYCTRTDKHADRGNGVFRRGAMRSTKTQIAEHKQQPSKCPMVKDIATVGP